ncbi:unnamed protein product [Closterium sp. NIES-64]|nr:unnamed protein product [Closterium sp. NIES-64]
MVSEHAPRGPFAASSLPPLGPSRPLCGPVAAPSSPVAALQGPSRPLRGPVPAPSGPVAAPIGPVAAPSGPVAAPSGPVAALRGPVAALRGPVGALHGPVAALRGPVAALRGPVAAPSGPVAALRGPVVASSGPVAALRGPVATLSGPVAASSSPVAALHGPFRCQVAEPPNHRAAQQPSRPAAEPPSYRAAQQPSCPAAKPPSSRAAQQPDRPATEPPSSRAAQQPSRPAAEPPSHRADPLSRRAAVEPLLFLPARTGPTHPDCQSALRLPLSGDAAPARAKGARALEGLAGVVEVAVEAVEGVGVVVGVVAGVEVSVAAVEAEEAAAVAMGAEAAEVAEAAAAVELVAALHRGVAPVVVRASCSSALVRPHPPSSFVSGTLGVSEVGVLVPVPTDEGDCYLCVPPDPGIEAAPLGASTSAAPGAHESALSGTTSAKALHTFTLDSGASRSFFRDRTTLTPLSRPVAVSLADPSRGPVLARFSTVLPCPVAPSGTLSGLYLPLFSTNLTLLWHHRLGHPSLPRLRGMASRVLLSGLPWSLPPLPPGPAPTCVPCVEGRQRAAPHSSEFPPTEAPLQTLHMDVWGPAQVSGQGHERYFLLVVDDYSRYPTVFPLRSKGDVTEGIRQTFTLPASPQQNGIAECRIGMVMDVARTSIIDAAAPHFLWPFAVQYTAHQLNLQPQVSLPETSPTLWWTGKVGDASAFRVWGSRAFVRDLSAHKLSPRVAPCVFLGFPPDEPGWQFYHPTSHRVLSSQDVTFDKSVPYYRLFPYRTAPLPPPPLFLAPGPPPVNPLPPQGPAPSGVSQVDAVEPVEIAVDSGAARGAKPVGAGSGGAESRGAEPGGAESGGAEPRSAEPEGAEPGVRSQGVWSLGVLSLGVRSLGVRSLRGVGSARVASGGASSRQELLSPQELREWFAQRWSRATGAGGATIAAGPGGACTCGTGAAGTKGATRAAGVGPAGGTAGAAGGTRADGPATAGAPGGVAAGGAADASASEGAGVCAVGAGGAVGAGAAAGGTGAVPPGSGAAARPRPYFVLLLEHVLGLPPSTGPTPPLECPQLVQSKSQLQPASPLPAPSPYTGPTGGLAERRVPASRPALPVRATRTSSRAPRPRLPAVPGTHQMALRPSSAPLRVPLPSPPESSLPVLADPESDSCRAANPTVTHLLATVLIDPSFESTTITDVLEDRQEEFQCFAAALPHLVSTLIAPEGDPDAPDIPTPRSYAEAIESPYSSQWQSAMDAEMASWKSTGTYVDEVSPPGANIVSGMWIFRVKRPPGSLHVYKARYVARGFSQRQGVDYFQTFSPTPKMTTLRVLLHIAAQRDNELHSFDFSTAFLQGSLHEEIWLRRPLGFTGSFPPSTQWSLRRPVYGLRQAPGEWHDTLRTTLAALGFAPSTADPSLFLRTDTSLPPFYILVYVDDLVFPTADTAGLAHVNSEL